MRRRDLRLFETGTLQWRYSEHPARDMTTDTTQPATATSMSAEEAQARQAAYAARRRRWAEEVGRPYDPDPDVRPPPGELDAEPDE
jgi:hypothetical protein